MTDARFFNNHGPFSLALISQTTGAVLNEEARSATTIDDVAPLDSAGATNISFFDNIKYLEAFKHSAAGACFVRAAHAHHAPNGMALLVSEDPYRAYAKAAQMFFPAEKAEPSIHASAVVDSSATVAASACIRAGAVIGKNAVIGERVIVGANSVIGDGVTIGDDTHIGALCSLSHSIIGARVTTHRGVHIGQDGFGFAMGATHEKVPQLGRVVIEDDVEIGSGTTIDRGTNGDTRIGRGAKIDNLVQIGHNVQIGKSVIMVSQSGVSGSTRVGNYVVIAGQAGIAGHLNIGTGAKIAAKSGIMNDIPDGESFGGYPGVPVRDWHRQTISLAQLMRKRGNNA